MEHNTLMFTLGFVFAFVVLAFLLKAPRRLRRAARVLSAIANALEGRAVPVAAATPSAAAPADPLAEDVLSALVNMEGKTSKARRGELADYVKTAIAANPGGGFDVVFRAALNLVSRPKVKIAA
jgi:hypothetical protein